MFRRKKRGARKVGREARGQQSVKDSVESIIFEAVRKGDKKLVQTICSNNPSQLRVANKERQLPIHYAIQLYREEFNEAKSSIVRCLIRSAPDTLLIGDSLARLPIHIATEAATNGKMISLLASCGSPLGMGRKDCVGLIPVEVGFVQRLYPELIRELLRLTIAELGSTEGLFLLHSAVLAKVPNLLLGVVAEAEGQSTSIRELDRNGNYPLHLELLSSRPRWNTVKWLLQRFPMASIVPDGHSDCPLVKVCGISNSSLTLVYTMIRENPSGLTCLFGDGA